MAASILLPGPTLPKLSTNNDWQMPAYKKICHELASLKRPRNFNTMIRSYFFGRNLMVTSIWPGDTTFDTFWAIFCIRLLNTILNTPYFF